MHTLTLSCFMDLPLWKICWKMLKYVCRIQYVGAGPSKHSWIACSTEPEKDRIFFPITIPIKQVF